MAGDGRTHATTKPRDGDRTEPRGDLSPARKHVRVLDKAGYAQDLPTTPVTKQGTSSLPGLDAQMRAGQASAVDARQHIRTHGTQDNLVPESTAQSVMRRAPSKPKKQSTSSYTSRVSQKR